MLDDDDSNTISLIAIFTNGPLGIVFLIIAIIVMIIVISNHSECSEKICENGGKPMLVEGGCHCLEKAK